MFPFPEIMLHAVCRDTAAYSRPCIYCHVQRGDDDTLEVRFVPIGQAAGEAAVAGGDAESEAVPVPVLDDIFRVMSECASLHPDPMDEHDAGGVAGIDAGQLGGGGDYFFTAADFAHGVSEEGAENLARLDAMIQVCACARGVVWFT